jgi:hypothetical protein
VGKNDKCIQYIILVRKSQERGHLGDLGIYRTVILKLVLQKQGVKGETALNWLNNKEKVL